MTQTAQLTKAEAAEHIGVSVRTLLRLTGKEIAHLPKRRESDATLYALAELDRYLADEQAKAAGVVSGVVTGDTLGAPDTRETPANLALLPVSQAGAAGALVTGDTQARFLAALEALAPRTSLADLSHKLLLSLPEAAQLSGLSRDHLRDAIKAGKLKAKVIGRGWKMGRAELEGYTAKLLK